MRELKFRAWNIKKKRWNCDDDGYWRDGDCFSDMRMVNMTLRDKDYIWEQYTGLKDKNGKEIYEGDIIQEEVDTGDDLLDGIHEYIVVWDEDCLCWGLKGAGFKSDLYAVNRTVEIVGNIHEERK